jgi:hypothetical protein
MRSFKKSILAASLTALAALFWSSTTVADCGSLSCYGAVQRLYMAFDGNLRIATDGDETLLNCTAVSDVYVTLQADDPNFNRKYALLLTAYTLDQDVGIRIAEGSPNCAVSYFYVDNPDL